MTDIKDVPTATILADIERYQRQQKSYPATSPIHAEIGATLLAPLFEEMARRSPAPKTRVVRAVDAGLCPSSKWYCLCERHSTLLGAATKRAAQSAARDPAEWCDACRDGTSAT
jgi:hypothetical protein